MKRIFLVGCGPSLNETPLDLLVGEDTFSINKIHLIYPKTVWRPTYYYYVDHPDKEYDWQIPIDIHKDIAKHMWLLDDYRTGVLDARKLDEDHPPMEKYEGELKNVTWVPRCKKHSWYSASNPKGMQEWHFPDICNAYNGMSGMIQISVQLGYDEIYLVGCDLNFQTDFRKSHFDPDYNGHNVPNSWAVAGWWAQADNFDAEYAHKVAKKECDKRGVKIYNATIGGSLEVYERKDLLNVLKS
jgi:hypothetical protein